MSADKPNGKPVTFLSDDKGNSSSMRLMTAASLVMAMALSGAYAVGWIETDITELCLYFLIAAFGGKSAQKFAEIAKK